MAADEALVAEGVAYRDIVILLRSLKARVGAFTRTLTRMGVPVFTDTGGGFFEAREVRDLLALLTLLDNAPTPPSRPGGRGTGWLMPALAVALVVSLVGLAFVWREWDQADDRGDDVGHAIGVLEDPADEAEAAARERRLGLWALPAQDRRAPWEWRGPKKSRRFSDWEGESAARCIAAMGQ